MSDVVDLDALELDEKAVKHDLADALEKHGWGAGRDSRQEIAADLYEEIRHTFGQWFVVDEDDDDESTIKWKDTGDAKEVATSLSDKLDGTELKAVYDAIKDVLVDWGELEEEAEDAPRDPVPPVTLTIENGRVVGSRPVDTVSLEDSAFTF